jgi:catechol 2,3-dioxygenase-like lactoylglutathione lyase family enzyme
MVDQQPPLANVITLGARDLPALRDFYRRLGWPQVVDGDDYAAFELRGAVLALFPADKLAADGKREAGLGRAGQRDRGRRTARRTTGRLKPRNATAPPSPRWRVSWRAGSRG